MKKSSTINQPNEQYEGGEVNDIPKGKLGEGPEGRMTGTTTFVQMSLPGWFARGNTKASQRDASIPTSEDNVRVIHFKNQDSSVPSLKGSTAP